MLSSKLLPNPMKGLNGVQARSICHKSKLKPKRNNYHWNYEKTSYSPLNFWLDPYTKGKFDENTKIIQVEGNVSAGKQEFAKQLAEELGMVYFPQPDLRDYYINKHGFDYMALNQLLPERLRYCDWEMFHENPSRHSVIHMQHYLQRLRVFQYVKALQHIFNTGQGVVLTRSAFTERAMIEAMHNIGWLPKGYLRGDGVRFYDWKSRYLLMRNLCLNLLLKPHLTIYLDTPVDTCLERIKTDPDPMIANSNALTKEFLEEIEAAFKDVVLPKQDFNMHVMMIDHPGHKTKDEIHDIIDDIETLDFEYEPHDTRFRDWNYEGKYAWWADHRWFWTTTRHAWRLNAYLGQEWYDIAGLGDSITFGDLALRNSLFEGHVGPVGYNHSYATDAKVHGFLKSIFGQYQNFGLRMERVIKLDCR